MAICGVTSWLILTRPDNFIVRMVRAPISHQLGDAKVITGPFPLKSDFEILKNSGVSTIVSLLNPAIPYESSLLEQEREMAAKYKIKLLSFPMSSILGQKFGSSYQSNAAAAAEAIAQAPGKVYLHCYLGLHRSVAVLDILKDNNLNMDVLAYSVRKGERSHEDLLSDEIDREFAKGNYSRVLELIPNNEAISLNKNILRSWSLYRIGNFIEAKAGFASALISNPDHREVIVGLAYSSMQLRELTEAEQLFNQAIQISPTNSDAWTGLGLTHFRSGMKDKARTALQRALELNPNNEEVLQVLAKLK